VNPTTIKNVTTGPKPNTPPPKVIGQVKYCITCEKYRGGPWNLGSLSESWVELGSLFLNWKATENRTVVSVRSLVIPQIFTRPRDPCTEHCGRVWLLRRRPHPVSPSWTSKCWKAALPTQWGQRSCSGRDVSVFLCGVNLTPWNSTVWVPRVSYKCSLNIRTGVSSNTSIGQSLTPELLVMERK